MTSFVDDNEVINLVIAPHNRELDTLARDFESLVARTNFEETEDGFAVITELDAENARKQLALLDQFVKEQRDAEIREYTNTVTSTIVKKAAASVCASTVFKIWKPAAVASAAVELHTEVVRRICLYIPIAGESVVSTFLRGGMNADALHAVVHTAANGDITQYVRAIAIDGTAVNVAAATVVEAGGHAMLVLKGRIPASAAVTKTAQNVMCTGVGMVAGAMGASMAALLLPTMPLAAPVAHLVGSMVGGWTSRTVLEARKAEADVEGSKEALNARLAESAARREFAEGVASGEVELIELSDVGGSGEVGGGDGGNGTVAEYSPDRGGASPPGVVTSKPLLVVKEGVGENGLCGAFADGDVAWFTARMQTPPDCEDGKGADGESAVGDVCGSARVAEGGGRSRSVAREGDERDGDVVVLDAVGHCDGDRSVQLGDGVGHGVGMELAGGVMRNDVQAERSNRKRRKNTRRRSG